MLLALRGIGFAWWRQDLKSIIAPSKIMGSSGTDRRKVRVVGRIAAIGLIKLDQRAFRRRSAISVEFDWQLHTGIGHAGDVFGNFKCLGHRVHISEIKPDGCSLGLTTTIRPHVQLGAVFAND